MTVTEFEHIVHRMRPKMMSVAYNFFHNDEDAEDAVQDVLLKMWKRDWNPDDDIMALATLATKNQCVSMIRKQRLRLHQSLDEATENSTADYDADRNLLADEKDMMIELAISTLTRSEQRIIRMKRDEALDAEEIAIITGIKVSSVRTMTSVARKKLIKIISKEI
ncbi:MAG: sigma-70 family RNA polymerase sigma factor [Bacteroidaceae bacterium]|nr:sigma-70 family RNA polymerase sigma factor [Bacteroidaceae bacterium]